MDIQHWQKVFTEKVLAKFPKGLPVSDRFLCLIKNVSDAADLYQAQAGIRQHYHPKGDGFDQALAACFIDLFVLASELGVDLEGEWKKSVTWFEH